MSQETFAQLSTALEELLKLSLLPGWNDEDRKRILAVARLIMTAVGA